VPPLGAAPVLAAIMACTRFDEMPLSDRAAARLVAFLAGHRDANRMLATALRTIRRDIDDEFQRGQAERIVIRVQRELRRLKDQY
jgi:siroheme synthase